MKRRTDAGAIDFPWAARLSLAEQRKLRELWSEAQSKAPEPGVGVVLRLKEAAPLLGLARHQIRLMVNRGRIGSFRRGGARLIPLAGLEGFARSWRGKRRWGPPRPWTESEEALLGTMSDREVAERLGCSSVVVRWRRLQLGKGRPAKPGARRYVWSPEQDALVGTMSDRELGFKLGRSRSIVITRRRKLGVPAYRGPQRRWTAAAAALLGNTLSDVELASRLNRSVGAVIRHRELAEAAANGARVDAGCR